MGARWNPGVSVKMGGRAHVQEALVARADRTGRGQAAYESLEEVPRLHSPRPRVQQTLGGLRVADCPQPRPELCGRVRGAARGPGNTGPSTAPAPSAAGEDSQLRGTDQSTPRGLRGGTASPRLASG